MSGFRKSDTPLDRARTVARSYREALRMHEPELCARLDEEMVRLGQTWVRPQIRQYEFHELLTVAEAADYCQVEENTIYVWRGRGLKVTDTPDGARYMVGDLLEYRASRRRRRSHVTDGPSTSCESA